MQIRHRSHTNPKFCRRKYKNEQVYDLFSSIETKILVMIQGPKSTKTCHLYPYLKNVRLFKPTFIICHMKNWVRSARSIYPWLFRSHTSKEKLWKFEIFDQIPLLNMIRMRVPWKSWLKFKQQISYILMCTVNSFRSKLLFPFFIRKIIFSYFPLVGGWGGLDLYFSQSTISCLLFGMNEIFLFTPHRWLITYNSTARRTVIDDKIRFIGKM